MHQSMRVKVALLLLAVIGGTVGASLVAREAASSPPALAGPAGSAAAKVGVFAKGGTPPADVPAAVRAFMDRADPSLEGAALPDRAVGAASGLGRQHADVWLYPTAKGAACFAVLVGEQSGACVMHFDRTMPSAVVVHRGTNVPTTVVGVAPSSATAVDVVVDGRVESALRQNNVVFWEAEDMGVSPEAVEAVITRFANGTSVRQNWGPAAH